MRKRKKLAERGPGLEGHQVKTPDWQEIWVEKVETAIYDSPEPSANWSIID